MQRQYRAPYENGHRGVTFNQLEDTVRRRRKRRWHSVCTPSDFLREIVESAIFERVYKPRRALHGTYKLWSYNLTKLNNRVYESKLLGYTYAIIMFI